MKKIATVCTMAAMMACSSVEQKQEQASETSVIGQPDVKIENGQMSPEVLWAFGRVGNMCVSPDGKRVAYTVTYYSVPENKSNSEVYVMDADGANKKQLTRTAAREGALAWLPSGSAMNKPVGINRRSSGRSTTGSHRLARTSIPAERGVAYCGNGR